MFYDNRKGPTLIGRCTDKLHDRLDIIVAYAVALWLMFVTLPSLDKAITLSDGTKLFPSRGTPGSCYKTSDGQHYVRLRGGNRKVGKVLGGQLIARSIKIRRTAIAIRVAAVAVPLVVAAVIAVLLS